MINKLTQKLILGMMLFVSTLTLAQNQSNTVYFMDNVPYRYKLNPAFQPKSNIFIGLPVLSYTQSGFGNNSLSLQDLIYKSNGKTISFMHPEGDRDKTYNKLRSTTKFNIAGDINLLTAGWRHNDGYWIISSSLKTEGNVTIPRSIMKFLIYGNQEGEVIDLKNLGVDAISYIETGVNYSRPINEKLSLGAKVNFLVGIGNASLNNSFKIQTGVDRWVLSGDGTMKIAGPFDITLGDNLDDFDIQLKKDLKPKDFKPRGYGASIDFGALYKYNDKLNLSASVNNLGFIRWNNQTNIIKLSTNHTFDGVNVQPNSDKDGEDILKYIADEFKENTKTENYKKSTSSALTAKLNLGGEYAVYEDKLSVGLLSTTALYKKNLFQEITVSANYKPADWADLTLSHSFVNGNFSTIGAGIAAHLGVVDLFVATDFIPFSYTKVDNVAVPYKAKTSNVTFGLAISFGEKDSDKDGVADKYDICPDTPRGVKVDAKGCPIDTDGDGVPDYLDQCPDTPVGEEVDASGCPIDSDGDGVPDYLDKCPDTPADMKVDAKGCPIDTDGDGVPDYLDQCPDTPAGVKVDINGCPIDSDGDGVPDYLDQCPDEKGTVENKGCPEVTAEKVKELNEYGKVILFNTGKYTFQESSYKVLDSMAKIMNEYPSAKFKINGHTDSTGNEKINQPLSENRANAVKEYMIKNGVDASRLQSQGYGSSKPIESNKTVNGRKLNRRVEVELIK